MKNSNKDLYIYGLLPPNGRVIMYVGKTTYPIHIRLNSHIESIYTYSDSKVCKWIKELAQQGLRPKIKIIEICKNRNQLLKREKYWIDFYCRKNKKLLNTHHVVNKNRIAHEEKNQVLMHFYVKKSVIDANGGFSKAKKRCIDALENNVPRY